MKTLKKIMSVFLAAAMFFAFVPSVMAEESPEFTVSAPTAGRIWCVIQDHITDTYGFLSTRPTYEYLAIDGESDNYIMLSSIVNEDGTFTEYTIKALEAAIRAEVEAGTITEEEAAIFGEMPTDIYGAFEAVTEFMHFILSALLGAFGGYVPEAATAYEAFIADYPDGAALHAEIIAKYFGGNEKPELTEIVEFALGDNVRITDEGYIEYLAQENVTDDEGFSVTVSEMIAPNGAYRESVSGRFEDRNVFATLKAMLKDAGHRGDDFTLALITGYTYDHNGYLYTMTPEYNYVYGEDGEKITDYSALVDEMGNIIGKGVSLKEYAVKCLAESYSEGYFDDTVCPEIYEGEYGAFLNEVMSKYGSEDETAVPELPDDPMDTAAAEIEEYIAEMKAWGESDEAINEMLLGICGYTSDESGYIYESVSYGYVLDAEGDRIHYSDVMDAEGNLLVGNRKGENIYTILNGYLDEMDTAALLKGDVNGDGSINLADASAMLKTIAKWDNVQCDSVAADTNGDGSTNLSDVTLALQYIAGWEVEMIY